MKIEFRLANARAQMPLESTFFHEWVLPDGTQWTRFYRAEAGYLLRFPGLADFQIGTDGRFVTCFPVQDIAEETPRHLYLNQVLPLALAWQGRLVFHASTVEIGGRAVAFLGESGRGKSTLAASFATSGSHLLTDDALVLERGVAGYQALPGHPSIRLWDDSREALVDERAPQAPPIQYTSKARFLAGGDIAFCAQPRPLSRLYFLGEGRQQRPVFEYVKPADALIELVRHSFLLDIEARELLAAQFEALSRLVSSASCWRLDYARRFEDLARVRQAIEVHVDSEDEST